MADPPWDIHMELPYGTMSDDEMRQLGIPQLQDEGLIFLWVTGRAMELGRECLKLWGYERVDEIIWVKTNQLQRIIRTGRTGHWLNHGKEHCLVGMKGNPQNLNRGLDSDVIVAEVRATSHKPDEIYGMIERLSPGTRKIELFGRPHNIQPNWITLGNQVDGIRLVDPLLIENFKKRYPDGNCMGPPPSKFAVIMADPPWDIHMELPYGTMSDDEMRQLGIPQLQDEGLIFLWVTGRAMELGRECLKLWGYERVDEIIWVKTNQLQRIIRTGRTGHWLNHGKEHCLVGMKGNPQNLNRGLDSDVIVAEVRATSHKPDEIYGMIERLSPGTRKIELFGRPHNIQPNWITLGNQVDGIRLVDPLLIENFKKRYPDGNCMGPPPSTAH
ncbi:hypothetical protein FQA39_LY18791 [Lamprigera yunnana]|nr:hypothetical protein FQA39_LY18791 [Lamprigera yunnana]